LNSLYIFITSERADQYLNPIAYCVAKGTRRIVFVQLRRQIGSQVQADVLCRNVYDLAYKLSLGFYKYYIGNLKGTEVPLSNHYSAADIFAIESRYSSCLVGSVSWESESISYTDLKPYIYSLSKQKEQPLIDISCVSKSYIGDILSCCLMKDFKKLYTFDLLKEPDFSQPWKMLMHDLKEGIDFNYVNIVETPIFQETSKAILIKSIPLVSSISATLIFVVLALIANFVLGNNNVIIQTLSVVSAVLGITSFFLTFFPIRRA